MAKFHGGAKVQCGLLRCVGWLRAASASEAGACPFLGAFVKLQKGTISFVMSGCPSVSNNSETWNLSSFRKFVKNKEVSLNSKKITGTLHEDIFTFITISR
jgi:hypothetical protein